MLQLLLAVLSLWLQVSSYDYTLGTGGVMSVRSPSASGTVDNTTYDNPVRAASYTGVCVFGSSYLPVFNVLACCELSPPEFCVPLALVHAHAPH